MSDGPISRGSRVAQVEAALGSGALIVVTRRDLIDVSGPDAADYLQGQLSQDVVGLAVGAQARSLLLQPQGKIAAWLRVHRQGDDRFFLDIEAGHGAGALARLQRFKLRVDCELALSEVDALAVRGAGAAGGPAGLRIEVPSGAVVLAAGWPGADGFDILFVPDADPDAVPEADPGDGAGRGAGALATTVAGAAPGSRPVVIGTEAELEALRIRVGVPAMGAELDETTIPAAAGIVEASVDFTKGCYVGQELVARIDSRGSNTPTRLHRLRFDAAETESGGSGPEIGAPITVDGAEVGRLTSFASVSGSGPVGLGYLKRGTEVPGSALVGTADGAELGVQLIELPVDPPDGSQR